MAGGDPGLAHLVQRLAEDARGAASAEVALQKARLAEKVQRYKAAALLFVIAGVLVVSALVALLVGLILTLATIVGPGWATAIVIVIVLGIAGILAWIGKARLAPPEPLATLRNS